jgi:hypothetical protein
MARNDWLSKSGLLLAVVVAGVGGVVFLGWWNRAAAPAASPTGAGSAPGWEVRYNATLALARRGSDKLRLDVMEEMLDQDRQMQNFRTRPKNGPETIDERGACEAIVGALDRLVELHRQRPELDLSEVYPAVETLRRSPNPAVRARAERTLIALGKK